MITGSEKIILKEKRITGYGIIFLENIKNLELLRWSYFGVIPKIAVSIRFFGIGMVNYPNAGLKCYQGVNIYLTDKRIYSEFIFPKKLIFEIPLFQIFSFQQIPLKFGAGILIIYNEKGEKKNLVLILRKNDALKWIEEMSKLVKVQNP